MSVTDTLPTADQAPPRSPIDELIPGSLPPRDLDPLADGILMEHQKAWLADQSPLKLASKGRRSGLTFAEALDSTLIAATSRKSGGDSTWYIGDTKDKGREFIAVCARFAETVAKELLSIEEFVFEDTQTDGSSRDITAWRVRFASGFQVAALSSSPANIRGLQGRVVIDEAAFHRDVAQVIDACNALLIWGGVIRIISTHNGALNPFNELIREIREGKWDYSLHEITFDQAVANGLYERVCLIRGWTPSPEDKEAWYRRIRRAYGTRTEAMREELDAIPREGDGALLPLAVIEAAMREDFLVPRWEPPAPDFVDWPEEARRADMARWLKESVDPALERLRALRTLFYIGGDFGMRQDRSSFACGYVGQTLHRHVPLIVELRACPYDQQKQALFHLAAGLGRLGLVILDANGNGMVLAQEARQKFGARRVVELMPNDAWHRENTPRFRAAFDDRTIHLPQDRDVRDDLRTMALIGGVGKVPAHVRKDGTDGGRRHGDSAVSILNCFCATHGETVEFGFESVPAARRAVDEPSSWRDGPDDDGRQRLFAGKRGAW